MTSDTLHDAGARRPEASPSDDLKAKVADLAIHDVNGQVRRSAATTIARLDEPELYQAWARELSRAVGTRPASPSGKSGPPHVDWKNRSIVLEALAYAVNERSLQDDDTRLRQACLDGLPAGLRVRLWWKVLALRFRAGAAKFFYIMPLAAIGAAVFTALVRWFPAMWYYTWTQVMPEPPVPNLSQIMEGVFQAACGGVVWGLTISAAICFAWIICIRGAPCRAWPRCGGTLAAGVLGGFLGGIVLSLIILTVYKPESIRDSGWGPRDVVPENSLRNKYKETKESRGPWIYPIYGIFLGFGCASAAVLLRTGNRQEKWEELVKRRSPPLSDLRDLAWMTLKASWPIAVCLALAAVVLCLFLKMRVTDGERPAVWKKNFLDAASIVAGGMGIVLGTMYGFFLMRKGVEIHAQLD